MILKFQFIELSYSWPAVIKILWKSLSEAKDRVVKYKDVCLYSSNIKSLSLFKTRKKNYCLPTGEHNVRLNIFFRHMFSK